MSSDKNELKAIAREFRDQVFILGGLVALMWAIEIVDQALGRTLRFDFYGIIPRTVIGLRGIFFAPFLHGDFPHLIANTIPFVTLGWLIMLRRTSDFLVVSLIVMLIGGFGTWLLAAPRTIHIGASGVIFGYLGFLLFRGYFERRFLSILLSLFVGIFYGGLIFGVLPGQPGISWEGHLFGFMGGAIAAKLLAQPKKI